MPKYIVLQLLVQCLLWAFVFALVKSAHIVLVLLSIGITPYFLVAGYFWHGVWDIIHLKKVNLVQTKVPEWYIYIAAYCMIGLSVFLFSYGLFDGQEVWQERSKSQARRLR